MTQLAKGTCSSVEASVQHTGLKIINDKTV